MLNNVERLEKVLFSGGYFSVKNVVTLGSKSATGNRLDPIYARSYNSTKYNDRSTLEVIRFTQGEYLVFAYNDFENKLNEEIFVSYPHMPFLIDFINDCYGLVNTQGVFTQNGVASKYTDYAIESNSFVGGKKMIAIPAVWDGKDNTVEKGILLFLAKEDICIQLNMNAIVSLHYIVNTFNLTICSGQLLGWGMQYDASKKGGSTGFAGGSTTTQTSMGSTSRTVTKRGLFSNGGTNRPPLGSTFNKPVERNVPEQVEEKPIVNGGGSPVTGGKISMGSILDKASKISVDEIVVEDIEEVEI